MTARHSPLGGIDSSRKIAHARYGIQRIEIQICVVVTDLIAPLAELAMALKIGII
jgi:hypothetical protein